MGRGVRAVAAGTLVVLAACGDGTSPPANGGNPPGPVALAGIRQVGSGDGYSCALATDGRAYCWGSNRYGSLGNGTREGSTTAVPVSGAVRFSQLEVGDASACGLTQSGEAWCWGDNSDGQLGISSTDSASIVPVAVSGGLRFAQLSLGLRSTCGVTVGGLSYCWGNNQFGQLGTGTAGGAVRAPANVTPNGAPAFAQVSAGFYHSCARTAANAVYCWGRGQSAFGNGIFSPASPTPAPAASGARFTDIEVGTLYVCGRDAANAAYCWGEQPNGEGGVGGRFRYLLTPTITSGGLAFREIDAHHANTLLGFTCGLDVSGRAYCWGTNDKGQLGAIANDSCIFGSTQFPCSADPLPVADGRRFVSIGIGLDHACAVQDDGEVYCWGHNATGQLGDGGTSPGNRPVRVLRATAPG